MTAASYTYGGGLTNSSKCFPARTLLCRRKEGSGHWLVARRKAVEQKETNIMNDKESELLPAKSRAAHPPLPPPGNTLDGAFLMQLHCVDKPSELCSVDISEQQLNSVKGEDLKEFENVAYINASVNLLSLGSFSCFASLRELDLSLNWLSNVTFDAADFPHLEVLDLSYNRLSADAIVSIGGLPRLKVLHLSGNQLHHLPPHLGSSHPDHTRPSVEDDDDTQFKSLEALMLDDNKLSSDVFHSLSNLKRLQYLNLQGNWISEIPLVHPGDSLKHLYTSVKQQLLAEKSAQTAAHLNPDETVVKASQHGSPQCLHTENMEEKLPLPELQFLNLANNKIKQEEALLAAALFPTLTEMDIRSNPLTKHRSGDPPLLTYYLQERLGITIKRKKTVEVLKLPLTVSSRPTWKVDERSPKVPLKPSSTEASVSGSGEDTHPFYTHVFGPRFLRVHTATSGL